MNWRNLFSRRHQKIFFPLCAAAIAFFCLQNYEYAKGLPSSLSLPLSYSKSTGDDEDRRYYYDDTYESESVNSSSGALSHSSGSKRTTRTRERALTDDANDFIKDDSDSDSDSDSDCPSGFVKMQDLILPDGSISENYNINTNIKTNMNINTNSTRIPRVIHFIVRDKCVPSDDVDGDGDGDDDDDDGNILPNAIEPKILAHLNEWKNFARQQNYSILFHDQRDVDDYLSRDDREDLPFISNAVKCAVSEPVAKTDLAKFLILWDFGGIVVDTETSPSPNFIANGTLLGGGGGVMNDMGAEQEECVVDFMPQYQYGKRDYQHYFAPPPPRFIACRPKHYLLFSLIHLSIANHFMLLSPGNFGKRTYTNQRGMMFQQVLRFEFSSSHDAYGYGSGNGNDAAVRKVTTVANSDIIQPQSVMLLNPEKLPHPILTDSSIFTTHHNNATRMMLLEHIQLKPSPMEQCINLSDFSGSGSMEPDMESLLELVGNGTSIGGRDHSDDDEESPPAGGGGAYTCPNNLTLVHDTYNPETLMKGGRGGGGRKIPRMVHMTSKSRCVTDVFAKNIDLWRFPDHSFFMHDDGAVERLLDRIFPEFPLLQDVRHCVNSGAGLSDLWRYILIYEYGGIYTDFDNAPGKFFNNGTIIHDSADFVLEQERGGYPSQYFFVGSKKHPLSYFMAAQTMQRLMEERLIATQFTANVSGPGAAKCGMMSFIGDGYPTKGNYTGTHNRNVTVLGCPVCAKRGEVVRRDSVSKKEEEYRKMNMKHFNTITDEAMKKRTGIRHSCLTEIYRRRKLDHLVP